MLLSKKKMGHMAKGNRVLININVLGSAGPLRIVVHEEEIVASVIDMVLKLYAREGRLPILSSDLNDFLLYCPAAGSDALMSPWESIGSYNSRNFILSKKPKKEVEISEDEESLHPQPLTRKGSWRWKVWINKSISLKIVSY